MPSPRTTKAAQTPADPLADLRDDQPPADLPAVTQDPEEPTLASPVPLVTEADQEEAVAVAIAAWHADTVSLGFLHGGGACGCRYLARRTVAAILPVTPVQDETPED